MGPMEINGLPAHALLVHVVVVLVPVAAAMVMLSSVWPAARRRLGVATPLVALIALVSVPLTTHAGEWLEARVPADPLVRRHAELGDSLLPWVAVLFLAAAVSWMLSRRVHTASRPVHPGVVVVVAALGIVAAAGSIVQTYRIGDSGAKAVWHDGFSQTARGDEG
ncbi:MULTISPECIES: DUF2231 domain-containing protein [Protofrankia]|uniref:DUF2231 domain-containing protein n=1 Tax=Candidatus Protofrankia datiscae TaxID=2716812 RepID=F8B1A5_9ACTN|nr:hypothetical protein FsymDg_2390 [Candidatus Protofrankia datiscae]